MKLCFFDCMGIVGWKDTGCWFSSVSAKDSIKTAKDSFKEVI